MSEEDVLVVTCPVCGKVTQKSIFTQIHNDNIHLTG